jgi:hypothetical protein
MNNHTEFPAVEKINVRNSPYIEQMEVPIIEVDHHETNIPIILF